MPQGRVQSMAGMSMWGPGSEMGDPAMGGGGGGGMMYPQQPFGYGGQPPPFMYPMMTGQSGGGGYGSPFASPAPSDYALRPPTMFGQQPGGQGPYGGGAPRNSVMSGLGGYAGSQPGQPQPSRGPPSRLSSYSLATQGYPDGQQHPGQTGSVVLGANMSEAGAGERGQGEGQGEPPEVDERENPSDQEIVDTLTQYLASQDLMRV